MVHKALIGQRIPEIHSVCRNQHGHAAPQQRRRDREADDLILCGGGLGKGNIEDDEDLHGAQVKRQGIGVQGKTAQGRRKHMGHHFAALAGNGNGGRHHSRGFHADVLFICHPQAQENTQGAEAKPDEMIGGEQGQSLPYFGFSDLLRFIWVSFSNGSVYPIIAAPCSLV